MHGKTKGSSNRRGKQWHRFRCRLRAVTPPIYLSSTFSFAEFERSRTHDYSRTSNPTRDMLADTLTNWRRTGAVIVSSGMAAVDLVLNLLDPDDLIIAPHDCYGGTHRLLSLRGDRKQFDVLCPCRTMRLRTRYPSGLYRWCPSQSG